MPPISRSEFDAGRTDLVTRTNTAILKTLQKEPEKAFTSLELSVNLFVGSVKPFEVMMLLNELLASNQIESHGVEIGDNRLEMYYSLKR